MGQEVVVCGENKMIFRKKHIICLMLVVFLVGVFCPAANARSSKEFVFLLRFFDLNEQAYAYHRHCLSQTERINATFLRTLELVADELFAEGRKVDPNVDPERIKAKILERRYNLQYEFDRANMKEGCSAKYKQGSQAHYEEFSRYSEEEILRFVDEQTGG